MKNIFKKRLWSTLRFDFVGPAPRCSFAGFTPLEAKTRCGPSRLLTGFTLIEFLTVIALIFIMGAVFWSGAIFAPFQARLSAITRDLASDLRYVQQLALKEQIEYGIYFLTESNSYQILKFNDAGNIIISEKSLPQGIIFNEISGFSDNEVWFNSYGAVRQNGMIVLENQDNETKIIEVRPSGFIKID